jgi:tetratricopeptide (TPR) repeat protein
MRLRRRLAPLFFAIAAAHAADPRWIRLKSANFEMYSTASERSARDELKHFEQVRAFFVSTMGAIPGQQLPVEIIAFNSKKEYEPYRINNFAQAFYQSSPTADYIVLSEVGFDVYPVAIHEYTHLVVRHMGLNLPPWLNEGMAELYSTLRPYGDKLMVGDLIPGRFQALQRDRWVSLSIIVAADQHSPYYNEGSQAGSLYNEGWALTHMLLLKPEFRPGFAKLLALINQGTPTADAFVQVYGKNVDQIEQDLQTYLKGFQFKGAVFPQHLENFSAAISAEPAPDFDVKLMLAQLQNRTPPFEQLIAQDPKRPEPYVALAYLAWKAQRTEDAIANFAKAYDRGFRDDQMLWDYGRLSRSAAPLQDLLRHQPDRIDVRLELAAVQLTSKKPEAAMETLAPIKNIPPDAAPRYYVILAHAQIDRQMWPEARQSAEALKKFAKTPEDADQAAEVLRFLGAREGPSQPNPSQAGAFAELDCSGKSAKIILETSEGKKTFLIDAPNDVTGDTVELTCGPQAKKQAIRIYFIPSQQPGIDGLVRRIRLGN